MSDELQPRLLRLLAMMHEAKAKERRLKADTAEAAESIRKLADSMQEGFDRDVASHPDLAELNVQMDAFYPAEEKS